MADGFNRLDGLGWVREIADDDRDRRLAADYVQSLAEGHGAGRFSDACRGNRITVAIRATLRKKGKLKGEDRTFRVLEMPASPRPNVPMRSITLPATFWFSIKTQRGIHARPEGDGRERRASAARPGGAIPDVPCEDADLAAGDMVRITQNGKTADRKHRLDNGSMYRVKRFDKNGDIVLDNGWKVDKDCGHLDHGYVVTSTPARAKPLTASSLASRASLSCIIA